MELGSTSRSDCDGHHILCYPETTGYWYVGDLGVQKWVVVCTDVREREEPAIRDVQQLFDLGGSVCSGGTDRRGRFLFTDDR